MLKKIANLFGFHLYRYDYLSYFKDCVITYDIDGNVEDINNAGLQLFGYKKIEIQKMKNISLFAYEEEFNRINRELKRNGCFSGQIVNVKRDGTRFISYLSSYVIKDKKGAIKGSIGVSRNITNKIADRNVLDTIVHNSEEIIYLTDLSGIIKFINKTGVTELGYEKKEIIGKALKNFVPKKYHPVLSSSFLSQFSEEAEIPIIQFEMLRKDSTLIRIEQRVNSIPSSLDPKFKAGFQGSLKII